MTTWTLLLCEGAHDQAALLGWLRTSGWTKHEGAPRGLPESLEAAYPRPMQDSHGKTRTEKAPDYVRRQDAWIEIRSLQGDNAVLGPKARAILEGVKDGLHGVGVFVDADNRGIALRLQAFHDAYGIMFTHARAVQAGGVVEGSPKLGLWVAPDNRSDGSLSALLLQSGRLARQDLFDAARDFATAVELHLATMSPEDRLKLVLGVAGQVDAPSEALASALRRGPWFTSGCSSIPALQEMIEFVEKLTA